MAVYKRKASYKPKTPLESIIVPKEYWGMKAICYRMSCSGPRLKKLAIKYGFPLLRLPIRSVRSWTYYTSENLILLWQLALVENTKRYLLEHKATGTSKLRENQELVDPIRQVLENKELACTQELTSEQPSITETTSIESIEEHSGAAGSGGELCPVPGRQHGSAGR